MSNLGFSIGFLGFPDVFIAFRPFSSLPDACMAHGMLEVMSERLSRLVKLLSRSHFEAF